MARLSHAEEKHRNEMFQQGQLWCAECKQFKPVKEFWKWRNPGTGQSTNYGYRTYCIQCENTVKRNKDRNREYYQERNNQLKAKFVELAGGKCQRCGYHESPAAMDFHHVYPAEKKYLPTNVIYSGNFEKAWRELDKCCLLCRNCHAMYTAGLWRVEFIKRDGLGWTVGDSLPLNDKRYEGKPEMYYQAQLPTLFLPKKEEIEQLELFG